MYRFLRILVSVVSGTCCLLVIALWAISHARPATYTRRVDDPKYSPNTTQVTKLVSSRGMLEFTKYDVPKALHAQESPEENKNDHLHRSLFTWRLWQTGYEVHGSYPFLAVVLGAISILPWASHIHFTRQTTAASPQP